MDFKRLRVTRTCDRKLQSSCLESFQSLPSGRTLVWHRARIHSGWAKDQVHDLAIRLAAKWLPRCAGALLLLSWFQQLFRPHYCRLSLQVLSVRGNKDIRDQCRSYAWPVGISSRPSRGDRNRRLAMDLTIHPVARG